MPDQKLPAFAPESYFTSGPFSDAINPQRQPAAGADLPIPGAKIPGVAAAAGIIDKFLGGVAQGRERQFRMQEAEQRQQVGVLNNKLSQIQNDPTRTDADKQAAAQPIYRALGQIMGGSIEGMDQKGGKKKKSADGSSGGGDSNAPQGVGYHLLGIAKDFATGLAGGKFPKELDPKTVKNLVGSALVDSDVALSKAPTIEALTNQFQQGMAQTAQGAQGKSWQEAAGGFDQHRQLASRIDPQGKNRLWERTIQDYQTRFDSAPPGSKEYYAKHPEKWSSDYKNVTGQEPSTEAKEDFFSSITGVTRKVTTTYGKSVLGSDVIDKFPKDVFGHDTAVDRRYATVNENGRAIGVTPDAGKGNKAQELQGIAEDFYRDKNGLEPDSKLNPVKKAEALRDYKKFLIGQAQSNPVLDIQVWDYLIDDKFDVKGIGNSATEGAQQILARAGQVMDRVGLTPGDILALRADYKSQKTGLARVITQGDIVEMLEDQLHQNMDIARELSARYKRGDQTWLNALQNAFSKGTGDKEFTDYAAQLHAVTREWAKLMGGGIGASGVPIKEAEEADAIVSKSLSDGTLQSLFDNVISKDAKTRGNAVEKTRQDVLGKIRGLIPSEAHEPPAGAHGAKSAIAVNNISGLKRDGAFVEYPDIGASIRDTYQDITQKQAGHTSTNLKPNSTLGDYVQTWTGEDPKIRYKASEVADYLKSRGVKDISADTPFSKIDPAALLAATAHFESKTELTPQQIAMALLEQGQNAGKPGSPAQSASPPGAGTPDKAVEDLLRKHGLE